jgi:uncharacterized damage-inducible protein DinB
MVDHLGKLFRHLTWADERTLEALRAAGGPPPKALEVYSHVLAAEHLWLARLRQVPSRYPVWPVLTLEECTALGEELQAEYAEFLSRLDRASLTGEVAYTNSAGASFRSSIEDILLHVALHCAYHRGQVAQLLRQGGATPQPTDYIAFVRGAPTATRVAG